MDILYRLSRGSVSEIQAQMPDDPSYNTVRVTLGILERKGYVQHQEDGQRYLYAPTQSLEHVKRSATRHLLRTFYQGSPSRAILNLLGMSDQKLSEEDLDEIAGWIEAAKRNTKDKASIE